MFYSTIKAIANVVFRLIYRIEIIGKENIEKDGKLIICSNHTNVFDPVILAMIYPRKIHFMAKKELFEYKILKLIFSKLGAFPINRNETDLTAIKSALRLIKEEKVLGVFPEGTRVKAFDLNNAKSGTALLSVRSQSPVLPIYIEGNYRIFTKLRVYIGEPIEFTDYYGKRLNNKDYTLLSQEILKSIYSIKAN